MERGGFRWRRAGRRSPLGVAVAALLLVSLAASGAGASAQRSSGPASSTHRTASADDLGDCLQTLKSYRNSLAYTNDLLSRKGQNATVMFVGRNGIRTFVSVRQFTDSVTLQYLSGDLTFAEYKGALLALRKVLVSTRQWLLKAASDLRFSIATRKRCDNLRQKAPPPTPKPPQSGSFALVGAVKADGKADVDNPNAVELTITPGANEAIDDHKASYGGGVWYVTYSWDLPAVLTPGREASVTLRITPADNPGQNTFAVKVSAPGLSAQQLLSKDAASKTYEFTVPAGYRDAKELTIDIYMLSARVTYHYRR